MRKVNIVYKSGKLILGFAALSLLIAGCALFPTTEDTASNTNTPTNTNTPSNTNTPTNTNTPSNTNTDDENMEKDDGESMTKAIEISAVNFSFSMDEIRIKKGDTVTINFASKDGFHDWTIDEFNASAERVNTGDSTSVTFVADQAGTFEYYCSVGSHRNLGMKGNLIVE